jgi:hypothetical protein
VQRWGEGQHTWIKSRAEVLLLTITMRSPSTLMILSISTRRHRNFPGGQRTQRPQHVLCFAGSARWQGLARSACLRKATGNFENEPQHDCLKLTGMVGRS